MLLEDIMFIKLAAGGIWNVFVVGEVLVCEQETKQNLGSVYWRAGIYNYSCNMHCGH